MPIAIHLDFETYSEIDLKKCGAYRYARDPSTDILCAAFQVTGETTGIWLPGDPYPFDDLDPDDIVIYAWNSAFERQIWNEILARRYGWPKLRLEQFICVSAWARDVAAAPAKLEHAARFFGGHAQKNMAGHRLMLEMCKPATEAKQGRSGLKSDAAKRCHHTPQNINHLADYCADDVDAEAGIMEILPEWPDAQIEQFWESERINDVGVIVDLNFADAAISVMAVEQDYFQRQLGDLTGGAITTVKQYVRHQNWIWNRFEDEKNYDAQEMMQRWDTRHTNNKKRTMDSDTRANLLAEDDLDPGFLPWDVRAVIEIIDQGSKAATSKFQGMLNRAVEDENGDWRVHGLYMFAGAAQTGRYSSTGLQVHNLIRDVPKQAAEMIDACIDQYVDGTLIEDLRGAIAEWLKWQAEIQAIEKDIDDAIEDEAPEKEIRLLKDELKDAWEFKPENLGEFGTLIAEWVSEQKGKPKIVAKALEKNRNCAFGGTAYGFIKGPIHALAALIRPTIIAPPKKYVVWGDWSAIEARALPWLSLHPSAEELLARYRRNEDVYRYQAAKFVHKDPENIEDWERQAYGKVPILSLGYGGADGAFIAMARAYGVSMDADEIANLVIDWRLDNPWAKNLWNKIKAAAMWAMQKPEVGFGAGRLNYRYEPEALDGLGALFCTLPSGRRLCYPGARVTLDINKFSHKPEEVIKARKGAWVPKAGTEKWPEVTLWHGLLAENATQATCADLLREKVVAAPWEPYQLPDLCMHTHDELMCESDDPEEDSYWLKKLMEDKPRWPGADALPLTAEVKFGERYKVAYKEEIKLRKAA